MLSRRLVKAPSEGLVKTNLGLYYNYKLGYNDTTKVWANLGDTSIGGTSITMFNNPVLQSNGLYFNGTNIYGDGLQLSSFNGLSSWSAEVFLGEMVNYGVMKSAFSAYFESRYAFVMGYNYSDLPFVTAMINNIYYTIQGTSACTTDSLLTFTIGNTGMKLYVNGELVASNGITGTLIASSTSRWTIGARQTNATTGRNSFFSGRIQSVRLYTKELSAGEVIQNYSVGSAVGL